LHIGNYFGAMKQYVDLQDEYRSSIFIADFHALTSLKDSDQLKENILNVYLDYLAIGLDPEKTLIFPQSAAPQVTELAWMFSTLITIPWLERAHAFKDKTAKGLIPNVGLFNYPVLMAADILIADGEVVPVGEDQRQHVEMAREIARKFNETYDTNLFTEPQELIKGEVATVPGLDGAKMSKSYGNTIPLFSNSEDLYKLSMSVVTESTPKGETVDPNTNNVYQLYKLVANQSAVDQMAEEFQSGQLGFKDAKERLYEALEAFIAPMRAYRESIDRDQAMQDLKAAGEVAHYQYEQKMIEVRKVVGLR
jgi:tryptophanyl-tRNA synthetase